MTNRRLSIAAAMLLVAGVVWGGMFPVAASALPALDAFYLTAIRYSVTALLFLTILIGVEGVPSLRLEGRGTLAAMLGATGFAGFGLFSFVGLGFTRPEHGAIVMALQPLIAVLINWGKSRVRPSAVTLAAVATAFFGVLLVITGGRIGGLLSNGGARGDFLILLGAVSWVVYTMGATSFPTWSPLRYTTLTCALSVPAILAATLAATFVGYSHVPTAATLANLGAQFAYIIALASVVAVLAWNAGIRALGASNGVLFINVVPVTALVIGSAQGHDLGAGEIIGAGLVIGALFANSLFARTGQAKRASAVPAEPAALSPCRSC